MFLDNSRYRNVATVQTTLATGEVVVALKLRRPTPVDGAPRSVRAGDRLDLIAHELNGDATQFWHVADANSAAVATQSVGPIGAGQIPGTVDPSALGVIPGATPAASDEETTANQLNSAPTLPPRPTATTAPGGVVPTLASGG